jgi:hypothetical protein
LRRFKDSEDCYIRHKDNLEQHIPLDEVSEEEIENAEKLATKISSDNFMDRYVKPYFNAPRRLS